MKNKILLVLIAALPTIAVAAPSPSTVPPSSYFLTMAISEAELPAACGRFAKIERLEHSALAERGKIEAAVESTFGPVAANLKSLVIAHTAARLYSVKSQNRPSLIIDIFHFSTADGATTAAQFVERITRQTVNRAFWPYQQTLRSNFGFGAVIRPHPDELPLEGPRPLSDICADDIREVMLKKLEKLSSPWESAQPEGKSLAEYIHGNKLDSGLGGMITDSSLKQVTNFPELESIALDGSYLSPEGYDALSILRKVRTISLGPAKIGDRGTTFLATIQAPKVLRLGNNRLTDSSLVNFSNLTELVDLSLRGNSLTGTGFPQLAKLKRLKNLGLNGNPITDSGIALLPPLPELQSIMIAGANLSDSGMPSFAAFPALRSLVLRKNQITDRGLAALAEAKQLELVDLLNTNVTAEGIKKFHQLRPNVAILANSSDDAEKRLYDSRYSALAELFN